MIKLTPDQQKVFDLLQQTYCRLKPSPLGGVGVFAVRPISQGTNPFIGCDDNLFQHMPAQAISQLDPAIQKMIGDFFVKDIDDNYYIPNYGLNGLNLSYFINHNDNPNLKTIDDGVTFVADRNIVVGEELTADYQTYEPNFDKTKFIKEV